MKVLSLIIWVTQFGFSILFPPCVFLLLANWLQNKFGFGGWIIVVCGVLGLLTAISTAKSCVQSMLKAAEEASDNPDPPVAFNDHN